MASNKDTKSHRHTPHFTKIIKHCDLKHQKNTEEKLFKLCGYAVCLSHTGRLQPSMARYKLPLSLAPEHSQQLNAWFFFALNANLAHCYLYFFARACVYCVCCCIVIELEYVWFWSYVVVFYICFWLNTIYYTRCILFGCSVNDFAPFDFFYCGLPLSFCCCFRFVTTVAWRYLTSTVDKLRHFTILREIQSTWEQQKKVKKKNNRNYVYCT